MGPVAVGPPATRVQGDGVMINHTPGTIPDVIVAITDAARAESAMEAYYGEIGLSWRPSQHRPYTRPALRFGRDKTAEDIYCDMRAKRPGRRPYRADPRRYRADGKQIGSKRTGRFAHSWCGMRGKYLKRRLSKARRRADRYEIEGDIQRAAHCLVGIARNVNYRGT